MLVRVDFYKETGKWYAEDLVEIEAMPWQKGVLNQVLKNQDVLIKPVRNMYVILSDIPESEADRNYRMTYSRLYSVEKVNKGVKYEC